MDTKLLKLLFENTELTEEIGHFCHTIPEYREAGKVMDQWLKRVEQAVGYKDCSAFENAIVQFYSLEAKAYYVFGLHLREEVKRAMMGVQTRTAGGDS